MEQEVERRDSAAFKLNATITRESRFKQHNLSMLRLLRLLRLRLQLLVALVLLGSELQRSGTHARIGRRTGDVNG